MEAAIDRLADRGELVQRRDAWHDRGKEAPHRSVDVRAGGGRVYSIVMSDTGELLGTADEHRAYATLHPGAVYLHMGEQYLVEELDLVQRVALVASADPDYYTQARDLTDIEVVDAHTQATIGDVIQRYGTVRVTNQVTSFVAELVATGEIIDELPLPLPPVDARDEGGLVDDPRLGARRAAIGPRDVPGAIHAAEHAAIGLLPWSPPVTDGISVVCRPRCIPTPA